MFLSHRYTLQLEKGTIECSGSSAQPKIDTPRQKIRGKRVERKHREIIGDENVETVPAKNRFARSVKSFHGSISASAFQAEQC